MTSYTQTFGAATIYPANVTYNQLNLSVAQKYQLSWPIDNNTSSNSGTLGSSLILARIMDINCAIAGASIGLPNTALTGPGEQVTFNNTGSQPFTVYNFAGTVVATIAAGAAFVLYYSPIPSSQWIAFQLGSSVSAPSVAAIAGPGLYSASGLLGQNILVVTSSTSGYTFGSGDESKLYTWSGGSGTWNLPSSGTIAASIPGYYIQIKNNGSGQLSLTPTGTDNINGSNAALAFSPGDSAIVVNDGAGNWYTVGFGNASNNIFQFLLINLAGLSGTYTLSGSELNKIAYRFSGLLAGNIQIVVPSTVQQYWIDNITTGGFNLTAGVSGQASPVAIGAGSRVITYCDGSNLVNASTGGLAVPIAVNQGGTGATSAGAALTNLGGTTVGVNVFTASAASVAQTSMNVLDAGTAVSLSVAMG